jgi:hypothetical protein
MSGIGDKRARNEETREGGFSYKGSCLVVTRVCPYPVLTRVTRHFAYIIENESVPVRP